MEPGEEGAGWRPRNNGGRMRARRGAVSAAVAPLTYYPPSIDPGPLG